MQVPVQFSEQDRGHVDSNKFLAVSISVPHSRLSIFSGCFPSPEGLKLFLLSINSSNIATACIYLVIPTGSFRSWQQGQRKRKQHLEIVNLCLEWRTSGSLSSKTLGIVISLCWTINSFYLIILLIIYIEMFWFIFSAITIAHYDYFSKNPNHHLNSIAHLWC